VALRRRRFSSRSKRHKPRWPGVIGWSLGTAAGLAALVGLAHLHGDPPNREGAFPDPALATLAEPAVAALAAFGALVVIACCVRHLRFEFLAWWPGRIVVPSFVVSEDTSAADVERLTAGFRDRLGSSHLQSHASVPAPAEQGDFLDVLARNGVDSGNLLGSLLSLVRAAFPAHAYEVNGALVKRDGPRPYGVTVQVVRLPGKGGGGHTVWDRSWEGAARQAADHATAAILPRTRVCRSPWAAWRRYYMPPALLQHYEHAAAWEQERRYDEALASYYMALDLDPMNPGLRLQIGFLQEKLGLFLDALDTYEAILQVAEPNDVRRVDRRSARRDRDRTLLVARYRHAVLLGGPGLSHQWRKWEQATKRGEERERLRERLVPSLDRYFRAALESPKMAQKAAPAYGAERQMPGLGDCGGALARPAAGADGACGGRLAELFLLASLDRLGDLRRRIPWSLPWRRPPISKAAVSVSSLVVRERLRLVLNRARFEPVSGWAPYIEQIAAEIASIEPRSGFDRWQEHYNVACIYSLPLLTRRSSADGRDVEELASRAVERLERATEQADTEFLVSRRDWLVSEDPDLQGLRVRPPFKSFEAAYFPSPSRTPQRPRDVHRWEVASYTLGLLRAASRRLEQEWEMRAQGLDEVANSRVVLEWCDDDLSARRLIRDVAVHHRDWRTRFELLDRMSLEVIFPDFATDSGLGLSQEDVEGATLAAILDKDARLRELARQLGPQGQRRRRFARAPVRDRQVPRSDVARLCSAHAELWRAVGELVTPYVEQEAAASRLTRALLETASAPTPANGGAPGSPLEHVAQPL
jgi:tetratricopeptide (TPR) repeat protein